MTERFPKEFRTKLVTSPFRANWVGDVIFTLGASTLIQSLKYDNFNSFYIKISNESDLVAGLVWTLGSLIMFRRTLLYYYKTIKLFQKMRSTGIKGDLSERLRKHFQHTGPGCKSLGVQLAIRDIKKYGDKFN
jgi:hypothetical protein